jgi:ferric-dicitrate binding protein FerR (iron transport regulator)
MPPANWEKWLATAEKNNEALARMEKRLDEIHKVIYGNGLSSKVNTLWEWRRDINKIIITLITALLIGLGGFIWQTVAARSSLNDQLEKIEHQLEGLQK